MRNQSSVYAVYQIKYARTKIKKIGWFLFLLIVIIGCSYQISKYIQAYLKYPVVITIQEDNQKSLYFPAITICNINRMRDDFYGCSNKDIVERGCLIFGTGPDKRKPVTGMKLTERRYTLSCSDMRNDILSKNRIQLVEFLKKYSQMDPTNRYAVGHNARNLIYFCSFNGRECTFENFTRYQSLKYGNCYTFNKLRSHVLRTSSVGYNSGLELYLNLELDQYIWETTSIGARVLIHDPAEIPIPDDRGVNLSPGFETSIALKQVIMHRLPAPYRDKCRDYKSSGTVRNEDECVKSCLQKRSYETCGCTDPTLTFEYELQQCNMFYEKHVCCLDQVQDQFVLEDSQCDCRIACFKKFYDHQISRAIWPSKMSIEMKYENVTLLRKHFVALKVFFSSLSSREYRQVPVFDTSEIFSNLGGQLSLWIGMSLFAIFELTETLLHLCLHSPL